MAMRRILRPWATQPQQYVPAALHLANGLDLLVNYGAGTHNLMSGAAPVQTDATRPLQDAGLHGVGPVATDGYGSATAPTYRIHVVAPKGPCTVLYVYSGIGAGTTERRGLFGLADSQESGTPWMLVRTTNSTIDFYFDGSTRVYAPHTPYDGRLHACAMCIDTGAGIGAAYCDGARVGTWSLGAGLDRSRDLMYLGRGYGGPALVRSYAAAHWTRAVSDAEMCALTAAPWSLFAPQQIWVPSGSAPPAYTHPTLSNARMIWTGPGAGQPAIDYTW